MRKDFSRQSSCIVKNPFSRKRSKIFLVRNTFEKQPIPIFDIGALGVEGICGGKLVPVILADLSARSDIREVIRLHETSPPGDMTMQWGHSQSAGHIRLLLEFHRPVEALAIFDFSIERFGAAIDAILRNRALYIQHASAITKISDDPNAPKVLCEIPSTGIEVEWEKMFKKILFQSLRLRGLGRSEAKHAAAEFISSTRTLDNQLSKGLAEKFNWHEET